MKSMKLAILLSGGKDSVYAAFLASSHDQLVAAITIDSHNKESYMFHTPNITITQLQAQAIGVAHIIKETRGEKEKELEELRAAIKQAKEEYGVEGIVTGAVASQYQASRVQQICADLNLHAINPLWQMNQLKLLNALLENNFDVVISGVGAYPFDEEWLGKHIDEQTIKDLANMQEMYKINPAGEGGEIETTVLDCPLFKKRIEVIEATTEYDNYAGTYTIVSAHLQEK